VPVRDTSICPMGRKELSFHASIVSVRELGYHF
jgi:hypothetical protein